MNKETKDLIDQGKMLPLMEEFYTIQGEGYHTGKAAYFIRIGGCDVGCHWCDVKESWNAEIHPPTHVNTIVNHAKKYSDTVVITGGEPLMWSMNYLTSELQQHGIKTHIETSGAYSFSGVWDWFCLSPKKTKLPLEEVYKEANELKMIIFNKSDFKFAEEQAAKVGVNCELFLQPEWSKKEKMTELIVEYVMKNPKWKISLQTHKYLNIP
ncbi:7-carboxy-7-deazaguanine synthase QueE [Flavobacteriaceae bacterium]|jgi:7-carboxy-7-deazaguanine synthase|nr:7-carboxy-7-deazaguanine synthase QueE [Flavobacteriaceae bacterium]MDB2490831.1 7-carboxy-7-deazaguanine synthase QueE [Flavobacteriaceae bacterium]MDB2625033.1 7-carboxy-7-deazaguanine synthase QueE [Flavobacteriaceae bacterium]MDG1981066.1 7-carboxy-7-deazaguanine synthase QueE [Flavobacteriaceae bacterium]|tara:strand:+ start:6476 stop:7105 length:630 start_codon:yes stop_codon:yes gene_type:complete